MNCQLNPVPILNRCRNGEHRETSKFCSAGHVNTSCRAGTSDRGRHTNLLVLKYVIDDRMMAHFRASRALAPDVQIEHCVLYGPTQWQYTAA